MSEPEAVSGAEMFCKQCNGSAFTFRWRWGTQGQYVALMLAHPGFGLRLEDAEIECAGCGAKAQYERDSTLGLR